MKIIIEKIISYFFAGVFLLSAAAKIIDFRNTIYFINSFVKLEYSFIQFSLLFLIVLEIVITLAFITDYWKKKIILIPTLLLLFGFISLNVFMIIKGYSNCGCFGTIIESNPVVSVIKNLFLFVFLISLKNTYKIKQAKVE